ESYPERSRPSYRRSLHDPYKPYLLKRWQEGCCNGALMRKSKLVAIRGLLPCSDASLWTCGKSIKPEAMHSLLRLIPLVRPSTFPLNFLQHRNSCAACLPRAPPGCVSASLKSLTRSNASRSNTSERDTVILTRPISSAKLLSPCWQNIETWTWMAGSHKPNTVALPSSKAL